MALAFKKRGEVELEISSPSHLQRSEGVQVRSSDSSGGLLWGRNEALSNRAKPENNKEHHRTKISPIIAYCPKSRTLGNKVLAAKLLINESVNTDEHHRNSTE